jgi:uncharacterized repeat protein (TIGR03847 family)
MNLPELIELGRADFVTIDTIGPPGQRTFFLQAAQGDLVVAVIIEKEHAAALAIAVDEMLARLGDIGEVPDLATLDLIQPVEPLFRVGKLGLGYDQEKAMFILVAEELVEEGERGARVHIWASHGQMAGLARKAAAVVAAGRPLCPLCHEVINPDEEHVCARGNGRKHLYRLDED